MNTKNILILTNIVLILFILITYSIREKSNFSVNKISSKYYNLKYENIDLFEFEIDTSFLIKYVIKNYENRRQIISFDSIGFIKSKYFIDRLSKKIDGRAYEYNSNGFLRSAYTYKNGKRISSAILFYDTLDYAKEYLYYNDDGELYKKQQLDIRGNIINSEE